MEAYFCVCFSFLMLWHFPRFWWWSLLFYFMNVHSFFILLSSGSMYNVIQYSFIFINGIIIFLFSYTVSEHIDEWSIKWNRIISSIYFLLPNLSHFIETLVTIVLKPLLKNSKNLNKSQLFCCYFPKTSTLNSKRVWLIWF